MTAEIPNSDDKDIDNVNIVDAAEILAAMTWPIYLRFQEAVAIGKWPDGRPLSPAQKVTCINAIIVYENYHVDVHQRTGFVPPKEDPCEREDSSQLPEQIMVWKD
jgi:uncharacterized protein YeaC (DUF1315 family)